MRKPKTQVQIDKATDARLLKKYGVGVAYYNSQIEKQGGGCKICRSTPKTRRLHIDHDHGWVKVPVRAEKTVMGWGAEAFYRGQWIRGVAFQSKRDAVRFVKDLLKVASIRGLLCFGCNPGLRCFGDSPERLRAAAKYLEDHQGVV